MPVKTKAPAKSSRSPAKARPAAKASAPAKRDAPTVAALIEQLPLERRIEVEKVCALIRRNLPAGYEETVSGRMIA